MGDDALFHSSDREIKSVFGDHMMYYARLSQKVLPHALKAQYCFEDNKIFDKKSRTGKYDIKKINEIYWREMLYRSHIAVLSSLLRSCRLVDATAREYEASNLPGWASCARALIESVGDSIDVLQYIPLTVSENFHTIRSCIRGKEIHDCHTAKCLEDKLIHFAYARKLTGDERDKFPRSHRAEQTYTYRDELKKFQIGDIDTLYGELCELSHPAAASVQYMFSQSELNCHFSISDKNDMRHLDDILTRYRSSFDGLTVVAFNSIFVSFLLLEKFDFFPTVPALRNIDLSGIPLWRKVQKNLDALN